MDVYTSLLQNVSRMIQGESFEETVAEHFFRRGSFATYSVHVMWDPSAAGHKYIAVITDTAEYIVVMPLTFIELHKNILHIVREAIGKSEAYCPGGGFVKLEGSELIPYGASQDFGEWDHAIASQALSSIKDPVR